MFASRELKRSESDVITQAALDIKLGDRVFKVRPLRILKAMEWRACMMDKLQAVGMEMSQQADKQTFVNGLGYILLQFPQVLVDLVLAYSDELKSNEKYIMDEATEEQMAKAFSQIMAVAFPYQGELKQILSVLGTAATSLPSRTSTK